LCFSPDGQALACSNPASSLATDYWSNQTLFFAAATGEELRRWDEGAAYVDQLAFSPDRKVLAQTISGVVRLRDARTGKPAVPELGLPSYCVAVRFSRDGQALAAGCRGGRTGLWDPLTGEPLMPWRGPPDAFGRLNNVLLGEALTAHGERVASVNAQGVLHVWEPATGKLCCRIAEPPVGADLAEFSPDGKLVVVKHQDHIIRLWDVMTGKLLRSLPRIGVARTPHPHAFSPDGRTLAIAPAFPDDGVIRLYETATGKEEGRLAWGDTTDTSSLIFSPDGRYLLAAHRRRSRMEGGPPERGGEEDALRLWDRDSGRIVRRFPMGVDWHTAVVISPDGKTVAAAEGDHVLLWEFTSGAERGRLTGHRDTIESLAFSPDRRLLASGSLDHTACVWDLTGICPDGRWLSRQVKQSDLERLWVELGNKDGVRAYRALWALAAAGPAAVGYLAPRLRPAARVEEERLTHLLADLDSDRFETRERATAELQRLGDQGEPALRKALAAKPSPEAERRLRALLDQVETRTPPAEQLHALRAVEALEQIGTAEAQSVLRALAAGAPGDRLTREAKTSLQRLTKRAAENR
jgi:WD40 repeat protein